MYGLNSKRIRVFTEQEYPSTSKRENANNMLYKMLDKIEHIYAPHSSQFGTPNENIPEMYVLMIHKKGCSHCEASLHLFENIGKNLRKIFPKKFQYETVEFNQPFKLSTMNVTGSQIYRYFHESANEKYGKQVNGVPFYIQSFKCEKTKINHEPFYYIKDLGYWWVSYVGGIQPLNFLSTMFAIPNPYLS